MVTYILIKYRRFQTVHKNTRFLYLNPFGEYFTKTLGFYGFCGTNISSTKIRHLIKPIHSTAYWSEILLSTPFIWVSSSMYANNGAVKVPILAEIGVRVQGSTSEIWNYPIAW